MNPRLRHLQTSRPNEGTKIVPSLMYSPRAWWVAIAAAGITGPALADDPVSPSSVPPGFVQSIDEVCTKQVALKPVEEDADRAMAKDMCLSTMPMAARVLGPSLWREFATCVGSSETQADYDACDDAVDQKMKATEAEMQRLFKSGKLDTPEKLCAHVVRLKPAPGKEKVQTEVDKCSFAFHLLLVPMLGPEGWPPFAACVLEASDEAEYDACGDDLMSGFQ